jgi:hypothetical protein
MEYAGLDNGMLLTPPKLKIKLNLKINLNYV